MFRWVALVIDYKMASAREFFWLSGYQLGLNFLIALVRTYMYLDTCLVRATRKVGNPASVLLCIFPTCLNRLALPSSAVRQS